MDRRVYGLGAITICTGLLAAGGSTSRAESGPSLRQVADVRLTGRPTRLDYQSLDTRRHLLFIAHLGDGEVIVVDTKARRVVATIRDVAGWRRRLIEIDPRTNAMSVDERAVRRLWQGFIAPKAHTVAVDPQNHRVYFPLEDMKGRPVLRIMEPH